MLCEEKCEDIKVVCRSCKPETDGRMKTLCNGQMKIDNWNNNGTQNTTRKAKD